MSPFFQILKLRSLQPSWTKRSTKLKGNHSLLNKKDVIMEIKDFQLVDLINEQSVAVIQALKISLDDLEHARQIVEAIPCVNDSCERAVQLATEFNKTGPKDEDRRQDYYLTINEVQNRHLHTVQQIDEFYATYSGLPQ